MTNFLIKASDFCRLGARATWLSFFAVFWLMIVWAILSMMLAMPFR